MKPTNSTEQSSFRKAEKKYKRYRNVQTNFSDVIDFRNLEKNTTKNQEIIIRVESDLPYGIFCLKTIQGFYFIDNALTIDEQLYWAEECFTKLPTSLSQVPNPSNLDSHYGHIDIVNLFKTAYQLHSNCHSENVHHSKTLLNQLRWITLGYHYNWTQRTYDKNHYSPFPENLSELTVSLAKCVGYRIKPEAAIVNFYHFDSTLCGHLDDVEFDMEAPIISISIGNSAVFLLGGRTNNEEPIPMFVRSGDVVVMGGQSRLCMHGVPRIIENSLPQEFLNLEKSDNLLPVKKAVIDYLRTSRININVRQVFKEDQHFPSNCKKKEF